MAASPVTAEGGRIQPAQNTPAGAGWVPLDVIDSMIIGGVKGSLAIGTAVSSIQESIAFSMPDQLVISLIDDPGGKIINSFLWTQLTIAHLGMKRYAFRRLDADGYNVTLTFENAAVALLRRVTSYRVAARQNITRLDFCRSLCRESGVAFYAPEAGPPAPTLAPNTTNKNTTTAAGSGFITGQKVTVQGATANQAQLANLTEMLQTAISLGAPEQVLVACVMAVTQESRANNGAQARSASGHWHLGLFQQDPAYWLGGRDIALATHEFLSGSAKPYTTDPAHPIFHGSGFLDYYRAHTSEGQTAHGLAAMIERIQRSGLSPDATYARWYGEAQQTVAAFARTGKHTTRIVTDKEVWSRGEPGKPETSWDALNRLIGEIGWRCFMRNDTVWAASDEWLNANPPYAILEQGVGAVGKIKGSADTGRAQPKILQGNPHLIYDTLSVQVDASWVANPGYPVLVKGRGPLSGVWLLSSFQRSYGKPDGQLTLVRPAQTLPEPVASTSGSVPPKTGNVVPFTLGALAKIVQPVPDPYFTSIVQGLHQTSGLTGYPAYDFGGRHGGATVACEDGVIDRISGHDPSMGPLPGVAGVFGWNIYLTGKSGASYFYTHVDRLYVKQGDQVKVGDTIGTICDWERYGRPDHIHLGVKPPPSGHPDIQDVGKAPRVRVGT